jgi:hypothetical protein
MQRRPKLRHTMVALSERSDAPMNRTRRQFMQVCAAHISIAGACATATHGSGIENGNLATAAPSWSKT